MIRVRFYRGALSLVERFMKSIKRVRRPKGLLNGKFLFYLGLDFHQFQPIPIRVIQLDKLDQPALFGH